MLAKVLVAGIIVTWTIMIYAMFGYMMYEYIIYPGNWNLLKGTCCEIIQWVPLYAHIVGACIMIVFGSIQILRMIRKIPGHRYTGGIYIIGAILSSFGGIFFMNFNETVGGTAMTVPFTVYGMIVFTYAMITMTTGIYRRKVEHRFWLFRMYFVGTSSVFYRVLYLCTYLIDGHERVTFHNPLDMAFNWLFFVVPMFMVEIGLLMYYQWAYLDPKGKIIYPDGPAFKVNFDIETDYGSAQYNTSKDPFSQAELLINDKSRKGHNLLYSSSENILT